MKRKSIVVLLVLLLVGILAFTAFACNNNKNKDDDDKKPPVEEKPEETPNYLSEALPAIISGADNLIKELAAIKDEAYISAGLELGVLVGEGEDQFELDVALSLKASISKNTTAKNWAFVEIALGGDEGNNVALFAEAASANEEVIYLGQSLTDADYKWTKLSQLDVSELAEDSAIARSLLTGEGGLISKVYTAIQKLKTLEINNEDFGLVGSFEELAGSGLLANSAIGGLVSVVANAGGELIPTTKSNVSGDTVYEATLNIPAVSGLLSGLGNLVDLSGMKDIIDTIGPILLGLTYDQITNPNAQVSEDPADYPTIDIVITISEDGTLKGLSLHYDYNIALTEGADPTFVALDLKISDLAISSTAQAVESPEGVENAEEFAAHITLDAAVPSLNGEQASATVDVYVNPELKLGWDEDGYVAIDFSGLEGYATLSYKRGNGALVQNVMVAQYNNGLGGFVLDLEPVFALAGTTSVNGTYDYFIALDAQTMYDNWIAEKKTADATPAAAPMNAASDIDTIIDSIAGMVESKKFDFTAVMGLITPVINTFDSLQAIFEDTSLVVLPDLDDNATSATVTVKLVNLMSELLASDGLIGGLTSDYVSFGLYTGTGNEKASYTLAKILKGDDVLGHIVTLVNSLIYESKLDAWIASDANTITIDSSTAWIAAWKEANAKEEDEEDTAYDARAAKAYEEYVDECEEAMFNAAVAAVGTYEAYVAANPGAFIVIDDVYAWAAKLGIALSADQSNLYEAIGDVEATVSYRDGISAELSLAGLTIGISANIEEYVAPETDMVIPAEVSGTLEEVVYSNYTANDKGRLLFNTLKELANEALLDVTDGADKFEQAIVTVTLNPVV